MKIRSMRLLVATCLALSLAGSPASALTVTASPDSTGPLDVTVSLAAGEPTGTVVLYDGSAVIGEQLALQESLLFGGLQLLPGPHTLHATLGSDGGTLAVSPRVSLYQWSTPGAPRWLSPTTGAITSPCTMRIVAGASTATMTLRANGKRVKSVACRPGQQVTFSGVKLMSHMTTLTVESTSLTGETVAFSRRVRRREFPFATCILIDKSQYRLYWVKNHQLVKKYPIAHGRYNWTPVAKWKVLAKYKTPANGVYGPRKMRMFRRVGSVGYYRFVFTAYAIHGTNEPWVIGTQASHGCIRMYNRDILELWPQVPIGTMVVTQA